MYYNDLIITVGPDPETGKFEYVAPLSLMISLLSYGFAKGLLKKENQEILADIERGSSFPSGGICHRILRGLGMEFHQRKTLKTLHRIWVTKKRAAYYPPTEFLIVSQTIVNELKQSGYTCHQ